MSIIFIQLNHLCIFYYFKRVQDAFRDHAMAVREPPTVQAVSVTTNKTNYHTGAVWKKIYTNPELYSE